jgi:hypothetical protein
MIQRVFEDDFRALVGTLPYGSDPSQNSLPYAVPPKLRTAITSGNAFVTGEPGVVGGVTAGYSTQVGTITVVNNNYTSIPPTSRCVLTVGDYQLTMGLEINPGNPATPSDGATGIANAINRLPGFVAVAALAVVTVGYVSDVNAVIPFSVQHNGTVTNLVLTPGVSVGALARGTPAVGAPVIL